jgi:carboxymethylenebutenolidase
MRSVVAILLVAWALVGTAARAADPVDRGLWWDEAWWANGRLAPPVNHELEMRDATYQSGEVEVPVTVIRPKARGKWPGVLFVHGRRGLDDLILLQARRIAARGYVVYAPDLYRGRDIAPFPVAHDYALEQDLNRGLDAMLKLPDLKGSKVCVVSHTRGGYYTLKLAVTFKRQERDLACYVSWYPLLQDPNAPEPAQIYQYAPEVDALTLPTLILVGENEQYQRKRVIDSSVSALRDLKRPVQLVVYPGVGRGFDFRGDNLRTFADDLASKDAVQRAAGFLAQHLGK